jgi:hypothetical protein
MVEKTVLTDEEKDDTKPQDQEDQKPEEDVKAPEDEEKDESKAEDKDGEADKSKDEGAPDKYEDFSLPEDFEADEEVLGEFKDFAKEAGLSQEKAQNLIDMQTKLQSRTMDQISKRVEKVQSDWKEATESDKEFGGKDLDANLAIARKALDKFGGKGINEALNETGMGNHPELVRLLVNVGKAMGEDDVLNDGTNPGGDKSAAEKMFPDMPKGDN